MSEQELLEYLIEYLIEESYTDNEESALVLIEHLSEDVIDHILLEFKGTDIPQRKFRARQRNSDTRRLQRQYNRSGRRTSSGGEGRSRSFTAKD